jgi:hypothetical protein
VGMRFLAFLMEKTSPSPLNACLPKPLAILVVLKVGPHDFSVILDRSDLVP